jgi:hypothetical protein
MKRSYFQIPARRLIFFPCLAVLVWQLTNFSALALDPGSFTSLGANPFTVTGTYTINSAANPPVLARPGLSSINGVVSGGEAVFTFDSITISNGVSIQSADNSGALPVALLSKSSFAIAAASEINFNGADGVSGLFTTGGDAVENGGAAGPDGGGGGGGGGDEQNEPGTGGAGNPNGGNYTDIVNFGGGFGGSVGGSSGGGNAGGGGGGYGGNGGNGGSYEEGVGGSPYGNLGVNAGGDNYGTTLQGGSGGAGGNDEFGGGGGGGGGAVEIGALGSVNLAGFIYADGGSGGAEAGGGGAGGGVYVHGSSVSLTGGIDAQGGVGAEPGLYYGGGGGGRVMIFTSTGLFSGSMGNVNVSGGVGANAGASGLATLAAPLVSLTITLTNGIAFFIDGNYYYKTPFTNLWSFTTNVVAGSTNTISASDNGINDGTYAYWYFSRWSDGGAASHAVVPTNNVTYTAYYNTLGLADAYKLFAVSNVSSSVSSAGAFSMSFDPPVPVSGLSYSLYAFTNLSQASYTWTYLGPATSTNGTRYQFTDPQATNFPIRFYNVWSP